MTKTNIHESRFVQGLMANGSLEVTAAVLIAGFLIYSFLRMRHYKISFFPFFIIFLFPASFIFIDVGFHLFIHRIFLIIYFIFFLMKISLWPRSSADILNKTTVGAFVFIFVALTGLAVCIDYGLFFRYWLAFLSGILLYVCLLYDIESMDQVEGIVFTCIISGFVWSAVGLSLFFIENSSFIKGNVNTMYRVGSLSGDSNYFASVLICLIQLSFFWLIRKGGKGKLFSLVAFFTMGFALVFTFSRGVYIGIGAL